MEEAKPVKIEGRIKIGDYEILVCKDAPWIYHESGEGMGMNDQTIEKLHKAIDAFYQDNF